jgi:type IV pilus assembly protein PilZ
MGMSDAVKPVVARLWLVGSHFMSIAETPLQNDQQGGARPGVLSLTIKDRNALYAAYMPFVKGGGLFIPSHKSHQIGEPVFLLLTFPDTAEKVPVTGHVVWVTPENAVGQRTRGIGVQFDAKDSVRMRMLIERHLGDTQADRPTHTM